MRVLVTGATGFIGRALVPVLRRLAHLPDLAVHTVRMPLGARVVSAQGRHQFYTVRIVDRVLPGGDTLAALALNVALGAIFILLVGYMLLVSILLVNLLIGMF